MRKRKLLGKNFGIALACLVVISMLWGLPGAINAGAAENSPISFGETLSGSIDMAAEMDTYTFSASADDTVLVRMTVTSGDLIAEIRLYDPDGNLLDKDWSSTTAEISHTLPTSGSYTILACDDIGNRTGEYNIYLQRLNNPGNATPISFGETLSGSIDMAAEVDTYTFSAGADDTVLVRMTVTSGDLIAEIRLYDPDGNLLDEDWSSSTAEISHTLPTSGTYTILACDDIGNRTGGYNIYLHRLSVGPEGSISGVVEDDEGNPIEGASVGAYASADFGQSAETDSEGQYTIYGLPSGWYWVEVEAAGFVGEWYDDAYGWPDAQPVEVIAPNDTPNINFTLEPGGSISGHVYEADENTPVEGAGVDAHDYDTNEYICHVTTDENGFYVINGLATGKYRLSASAKGHAKEMYGGGRDWWAAPPVEVTAPHETTGINFALEPGGTVSGTVYDSEMHPLPDMAVKAIPVDGGPSVGDACTDEDGHYTTAGVPYGEYKVKAWPGWCGGDPRYQPEYWEEKSNWENADIVTVSEGEPNPTGINFTLEIPTGSIRGVVHYTGSVSGSHQLWIVARRGEHWRHYRHIDCTGPGNYAYTISYVYDGTYCVAAILDSHDTGLEELVTDEPLAFYPSPVTVSGGGETSGIDITLADPGGYISGEITYSGEMDSHSIIVTASAQPYTDALKWPVYYASFEEPGDYSFPTIADGTYYLNAWLDLNGNWEADSDEPSGEHPDKVVISGGSSATDIDINIGAQAAALAERSIDPDSIPPGGTTTVSVTIAANQTLSGFALDEDLPVVEPGWILTQVDDAGAIFNSDDTAWIWTEALSPGESKTVVYKLTAPVDTEEGTYNINGWVKSYGIEDIEVGGEDTIMVTEEVGPWLYDEDDSGYIEIDELLHAISDYIGGDITISQLLEIISLYIGHTPK